MTEKRVFVEPSQAGPTQKLIKNKDGTTTVVPGKAHEAQDGVVTNPGVRTLFGAKSGPMCPVCHTTGTLRMHANQPEGKRVYCSNPNCSYDQAKLNAKPVDHSSGVKVLSQHRNG